MSDPIAPAVGAGFRFETDRKDGLVALVFDPNATGTMSASGKSMVIASTRGNIALAIGNTTYKIGANVFTALPLPVA